MRRFLRLAAAAALFLFACIPAAAAAEEVTVEDLTTMAAELAGLEVVVEGELVGDYGFRADGSMWTQLNGDVYTIEPLREGGQPAGGNIGVGVRIPTSMASGLDPPGGYRWRGPLVSLVGTWRYHDPSRQGESYLDVSSLEVIEPGRPLSQAIHWPTLVIGGVLMAVAATAWLTRPQE